MTDAEADSSRGYGSASGSEFASESTYRFCERELEVALQEAATVAPEEIAAYSDDVDAEDVRAVVATIVDRSRDVAPHRDPDVLRELYYDEGLTQDEVADRLGCGQRTISRWMKTLDIATVGGKGQELIKAALRASTDGGESEEGDA